jgi:hypothetical protein
MKVLKVWNGKVCGFHVFLSVLFHTPNSFNKQILYGHGTALPVSRFPNWRNLCPIAVRGCRHAGPWPTRRRWQYVRRASFKQKRTSVRISSPLADQPTRAGESDQSTSSTERLRRDDVAEALCLRRGGWRRGRLHLSLGADGEVRLFPPDPFSIPLTARL